MRLSLAKNNKSPYLFYFICGDKIKTFDEEWDDGNVISNDGCSALWKLESGFSCIQGQTLPLPWTNCHDICGDGKVFGSTQCDDGNLINGDGCSSACIIEDGYSWIDGSPTAQSQWSEIWGDGLNFGHYEWDDGDRDDGDGWDYNWMYEKWYQWIGGNPITKDIWKI